MPRRKEGLFDLLVTVPWWVSVLVAGGAYVFVGRLVPLALAGHPLFAGLRLAAPAFAPWIALFLLFPAPVAAFRQWRYRRLLDRQTGIGSIRAMSWRAFETLVAEMYRRQGYSVKETGGGGPDGGVDMILHKGGKYLVQCKHWKAYRVGVKEVRELLGLVTAELAEGGILITSGDLTAEARTFSRGNPLTLVDGGQLVRLTREVQVAGSAAEKPGADAARGARVAGTTPSCPACERPMVLRTARGGANAGGQFWGCSGFPDCRATLSLT